jgi:hypothetical protein
LKGNNAFYKGAAHFGVQIRTFKADNAPFSSVEFRNDIANKGQEITFSGDGAHWCRQECDQNHDLLGMHDDVACHSSLA